MYIRLKYILLRALLKHLSLLSRRQEKFEYSAISDVSWSKLVAKNPDVKVTLKFDPSCIVERMREIMSPFVPVHNLSLQCYSTPLDVLNAADYYGKNIVKIVLNLQFTQVILLHYYYYYYY